MGQLVAITSRGSLKADLTASDVLLRQLYEFKSESSGRTAEDVDVLYTQTAADAYHPFTDKTMKFKDIKKLKFYGCKKTMEWNFRDGKYINGKFVKNQNETLFKVVGQIQGKSTDSTQIKFNVSRDAGTTNADKAKIYVDQVIPAAAFPNVSTKSPYVASIHELDNFHQVNRVFDAGHATISSAP